MRALIGLLMLLAAPLAQAQGLKPWPGGATPPLVLADLASREHRLADYRGKVVLVNFWATWCEPCREEMPSMRKLRAGLAGKPFEVLAVNLGEPESRVRKFLDEVPLDFPVLLDRGSAAAKAWRARVLPVTFVVGPDGAIRYTVLGGIDWAEDKVREALVALMPPGATQPRAGLSAAYR